MAFGANDDSLRVAWNANVEPDLKGYKIHYGPGSRNYTDIVDVGTETAYTVRELGYDKEWFFAVSAYDYSGNQSGFSDEISRIILAPDFSAPTIVAVNVISLTEIQVEFSEKVSAATAGNRNNYSINSGIQIAQITFDGDKTVSLSTTSHVEMSTYQITVNNIEDLAPLPNKLVANTIVTYDIPDLTAPALTGIEVNSTTQLRIQFTEAVSEASAQRVSNYAITNNVQVTSATLEADAKYVLLETTPHLEKSSYQVTVNKIKDVADTPNEISANASFGYTIPDYTLPILAEVVVDSKTQLTIVFSEAVTKASAENIGNYTIPGGPTVEAATLGGSESRVVLTTTIHAEGRTYELHVSNIKDISNPGNTILANSFKSYKIPDKTLPQLMVAQSLSNETVKLVFSEKIGRLGAENKNNYQISAGVQVIGAALAANDSVVTLQTATHAEGQTYTVTVNNIVDQALPANPIASNSQRSYFVSDKTRPFMNTINVVSREKVEILFSEPLEKAAAETVGNYSFNYGVQVLAAKLNAAQTQVELTTSAHEEK
ncbi:fibronectin type III domain-containing protein, partial [bacterium]|nr:fibronectin type III domain-containing protein [bacterium]